MVFLESRIPAEHPSALVLGEERLGTGVAVEPLQVLTAHYLVLGASKVEVTGSDGRPRGVRKVSLDHETGLALLQLEGPELKPAPLGPVEEVVPGLPIFLLTCTGARERKGATGHVSVVGPFEAFWEYMLDRAIMTTAMNPGLAGAPLFDADGRLLGVVSLGLVSVARYSMAIPVELYVSRKAELESGAAGAGRRPRAWVGFYPQACDGGLLVTGVVPGGPAEAAGLERGDLIVSVDGQSVATLRELYAAVWRKGPGDPLSFQILRESAIRVVEVVPAERAVFYR